MILLDISHISKCLISSSKNIYEINPFFFSKCWNQLVQFLISSQQVINVPIWLDFSSQGETMNCIFNLLIGTSHYKGFYKPNTDASVFSNNTYGGGIFRDCNSDIIVSLYEEFKNFGHFFYYLELCFCFMGCNYVFLRVIMLYKWKWIQLHLLGC